MSSALNVSAVVGIVLGSALVLLLLVLLVFLVFFRRRKHIRRRISTSRGRRLPTFADVTLHSEVTSFLPAANSINGLDFGRPTSTDGEVCRQPTAETDDMPPSYDSVVKSSDVVVRRRRDGNLTSPASRSRARLSLPPISATAFPPILRTHRRAESDTEEHIYEDPSSLRRSVSRDGLESGLRNSATNCPAENYRDGFSENDGPPSCEVDDRSPMELLMALAPSSVNAGPSVNSTPQLLQFLPYSVTSNSSLNQPMTFSQPRVPRVRLGTSALYSRPDSRTVDWCRGGDFLTSANHLQPFSPLSTIGYSEVIDNFTHPYQTTRDDFLSVHSPSFGGQPPRPLPVDHWSHIYGDDPELELRSQPTDVHSRPSGNRQNCHPTIVSYLSNDLSVVEDQLNSTSSARTSSTESDHFDMSQVSPLFDDDNIDSIVI